MLWSWRKISGMAEMMKNKGRILALDINQKRLDNAGSPI